MNKLDEFKIFIKSRPNLIDKIQANEATWQQLYEAYDIYGESHPLFSNPKINSKFKPITPKNNDYIKRAISLFQNIDMDKLSENLQSIKKVIGAISEISNINDTKKDDVTPSISKKNIYRRYND